MISGARFAIALVLALYFLSVSAKDACPNESFTQVKNLAEKKYFGWKVVTLSDLAEDDRKIWLEFNPISCPGLALGRFDGSNIQSYAISLIKKRNGKNFQMLVVKKASEWRVLSEPQEAYRVSVVKALPPGRYGSPEYSVYTETNLPVISYEAIEAGSIIYAWRNGKYSQIAAFE